MSTVYTAISVYYRTYVYIYIYYINNGLEKEGIELHKGLVV